MTQEPMSDIPAIEIEEGEQDHQHKLVAIAPQAHVGNAVNSAPQAVALAKAVLERGHGEPCEETFRGGRRGCWRHLKSWDDGPTCGADPIQAALLAYIEAVKQS